MRQLQRPIFESLWVYARGLLLFAFASCSPLRNSPHDEKHQWELKLHEVLTNLDDLKHDINCFQTEIQILEGRIKYYENALTELKQQDIEKHRNKIDQITQDLHALEIKWTSFEKIQSNANSDVQQLASHANETTTALSQFKCHLQEVEQDILSQNRRFEELAKLKGSLEALVKSFQPSFKIYRVRAGDSLEKIAASHHTKVDKIKKLNDLERDLIVVDQELKIPID
ncbi:MAG TPA: LysM peptidoglycan-binding domain-containing protein [Rhabdochlamydiaceae bacterium]|nr:LysM peptidoglycan-binding domain-containing protein [Rhabdochlamydiaceae bacterium]